MWTSELKDLKIDFIQKENEDQEKRLILKKYATASFVMNQWC